MYVEASAFQVDKKTAQISLDKKLVARSNKWKMKSKTEKKFPLLTATVKVNVGYHFMYAPPRSSRFIKSSES